MSRHFIIVDSKGQAYGSCLTSEGPRLFSHEGLRSYSDFRRATGVATVFSSLKAARGAITHEIAYRDLYPEWWPLEEMNTWYNSLRIVPVQVAP